MKRVASILTTLALLSVASLVLVSTTPAGPREALEAKFRDCVSFSVRAIPAEHIDRALDMIRNLENVDNAADIIRALS